jgi:hypothetical protein
MVKSSAVVPGDQQRGEASPKSGPIKGWGLREIS